MKNFYLNFLFILLTVSSIAQNIGDFQSASSGDWTSVSSWSEWDGSNWINPASVYPGQNLGPYSVLIQAGNTITIATNLATASMGNVTVNGILSLNPNPAPNEITLNTPSLDINGAGALLNFAANKVKLTLPSGSSLSLQNGGDFSGSCTANDEIYIGLNKYAACHGGGPNTYTFGDVAAAGGTINAEIVTPSSLSISEEVCTLLNIEGGYIGTGTNVNYNWVLRDPNGNIVPTSLDSGILTSALPGDSGVSTFTPSILGDYLLTLEVTEGTFTNVETRIITVTADGTNPTALCQNVTVQLNAAGTASVTAAQVDNGSSDNCGVASISVSPSTFDCSNVGANTVTLTVTDDNGNVSTCTSTVTVQDNIAPNALCQNFTLNLGPDGTGNISYLQIDNGSSDNCGNLTYSLSKTAFDCNDLGANTVTLSVTDSNGNSSTCNATVTVLDVTSPTVSCGSTTLTLDSVTGTATIASLTGLFTASDSCDSNLNASLAQLIFDCNDIGTNDVLLTVTDDSGNSSTCNVSITIEAPVITTGILTGIQVNPIPDNPLPADDLIEVSACPEGVLEPKDFELTLALDGSSNILASNIQKWQISQDNGLTWTDAGGTGLLTHTIPDLISTTLVRLVIQSGNCIEYSPLAVIRFLPPDSPPTIVSVSNTTICLGDTVNVVAESFFETLDGGQWGDSGLFNYAQPEDWRVDGIDGFFPASGNNTTEPTWKEGAQSKIYSGIRHFPNEGPKFAISNGPYNTTLETPIFQTVGMDATDAYIEFYQAYYFCPGAQGIIELSFDGGNTYDPSDILYTFPNATEGNPDTGILMDGTSCNTNDNGNHPTNDGYDFFRIDLSSYLGMSGLRIRFRYEALGTGSCSETFNNAPGNSCSPNPATRTVSSSWAIDSVRFPFTPIIDEELEWTDENGVVVATGSTVSVTPVTPGIREYGVTSLVNGCRAEGDDATEFIDIYTSLAYAGQDFAPAAGVCGQSAINLKAYDNTKTAVQNYSDGAWEASGQGYYVVPDLANGDINFAGTGVGGTWSVLNATNGGCGTSAIFSSNTDPRAIFTADAGTYTLRWTLTTGCYDDVQVVVTSCNQIDFDGNDDYVTFRNNYSLGNTFSIEAWIKPNGLSGNRTILSKKLANANDAGYNLNVVNGQVRFNWYSALGNGYIYASQNINTDRWYHVAVTYDGAYKLYIDGIDIGTTSGTPRAPDATSPNIESLLGAVDDVAGPSNSSTDNFHGWIDEVKIWNTVITIDQVREMMNQRIQANTTAVRGEVLQLDIPNLNWANLVGYYRMDVGCGNLTPIKGVAGRLMNINSSEELTAPLPYTSKVNGVWTTDNTWTNYPVWDTPNSNGINGTPIDWNIVRTAHNVTSGNKDITVLGLLVDVNELSVEDPSTAKDETNDGQMLWVTHYLKLDGRLDLVGESQLIQKRYNSNQINGSIFDNTSIGYAESDQQGQVNPFNYNYFSPPFAPNNATVNNENTSNTFTIGGVLRDGTTTVANPINRNIVWTANNTAAGGNPTQVSTRWLYAYNDNAGNTYSEWEYLNTSGSLNIGLGYTMKGSGNATAEQNYVFVGKPNNGTISNTVSPESGGLANDILLGNPYPSALDANEFIKDNIPLLNPDNSPSQANGDTTQSINGTLYFWEHYAANNTHILRDYQGGYATYNLSGGLQATTPPPTEDGIIIVGGSGTVIPKRYVPVAQGFFVTGSPGGGLIKFHNDQRAFVREASSSSVFFAPNNSVQETEINTSSENLIKRLRLSFKSSEGAERQLLLAFTPNDEADDNYNYGYDAPNYDTFPSDLSWSINNERYVIQGVGQFDNSKKYPFIMEVGKSGEIEISLDDLENFDSAIDVFIYDALLETYTKFNDSPYVTTMAVADYTDRFYLALSNEENLSTSENEIDSIRLYYLNDTKEIYINWVNSYDIKEIQLINILGQTVKTYTDIEPINSYEIRIPVKNISEGNYVIKVTNSHGKTTNKKVVIKQ